MLPDSDTFNGPLVPPAFTDASHDRIDLICAASDTTGTGSGIG